jgi:glycosyltransferase involved in cell wall biosynthesis
MLVLWLSHFIPYPPRGGNAQRSFNLLKEASRFGDVALIALNLQGEPAERVNEYKKSLEECCVEVEIWDLPYRWKGRRWWAELARSPLSSLPFSARALFSPSLLEGWKSKLARYPEALAHLDSIDLALYAAAIGGRPSVLNHHNCESVLASRRAEQETNLGKKGLLRLEAQKLARQEMRLCRIFGVNAVVCEEDRQRLMERDSTAHFHVVENGVDTDYFRPAGGCEEKHTAIFTGTLDWQPNLSAIRYLARDIWPLVKRECPDAKLILAGKKPPAEVFSLMGTISGIEVFANPCDMRPLLARAGVYVCPLLEGGGTRLKILDAMAMGRALVSTTIGCEGLRVRAEQDLLRRDKSAEFASAVVRLFREDDFRAELGRSARGVAEREYSWAKIGGQLKSAYECAARRTQEPACATAGMDKAARKS